MLGDIELFAWHARQPVVGVTGTNGKSTVTALAGHLLRSAGVDCEVAGNIGPPVLDSTLKGLDVGELPAPGCSSFQRPARDDLLARPAAAAMLDLTEDHSTVTPSLDDYGAAKARIFVGVALQVLNRDDPRSVAMAQPGKTVPTFGLDAPSMPRDFGGLGTGLSRAVPKSWPSTSGDPRHGVRREALAACAWESVMGVGLDAVFAG